MRRMTPLAAALRPRPIIPIIPRSRTYSSANDESAPSTPPSDNDNANVSFDGMTAAESNIARLLASSPSLAPITTLFVHDVSGGCGSMYAIDVASPRFQGLSVLKQQRLVNAALGDLIKQWHGVQIRTSLPAEKRDSQDRSR